MAYRNDSFIQLYEIGETMGIPENAWIQQSVFLCELDLLRLHGQKLKIPMYRFRDCYIEKNAIVCMTGEWTGMYEKGCRNKYRNLSYGNNYVITSHFIGLERRKEDGKLVANYRGQHTEWETLKNALEIGPNCIPMIKPSPEQVIQHKKRLLKINKRSKRPNVSDDESEDSYNS